MYTNGFYNPYMNYTNFANIGRYNMGKGLFNGLFKKFSFTGFLNGASKTLNVVNQAIPIYYQVKPMISNAKTMFRVMNAVKNSDTESNNKTYSNQNKKESIKDGSPTFFI